jgi:hypothetical protein
MSTQPRNAQRHTDGFKPGRLSRFQPSRLPIFHSPRAVGGRAAGGHGAGDGDYRLQYKPVKSPCRDKGTNQAWMDGAKDLAGNTRKSYGGVAGSRRSPVVDMGAYEAPEVPAEGTVVTLR